MADVLVRNVPTETLSALKARARRHRRSLQQELLALLEEATRTSTPGSADEIAAAIRKRLASSQRSFSDSVTLIREDRAR